MNSQSELVMDYKSTTANIISWIFGIIVLGLGIINIFWGNDREFGIFIALLSLAYFLPVNNILKKMLGFTIPKIGILKILLGAFIIWATFGVGELFDKIELMKMDL